jgi:hypothetical protein
LIYIFISVLVSIFLSAAIIKNSGGGNDGGLSGVIINGGPGGVLYLAVCGRY